MILSINNKEETNVYVLNEKVLSPVIYQMKTYFQEALLRRQSIVIDMTNVDDVDVCGALMLTNLRSNASRIGKEIILLGAENQRIQGAFRLIGSQSIFQAA